MNPPDVLRIGLHDGKAWEKAQMTFSDDPQMFASIYAMERAKTDEINATLKQRLGVLLVMLETLPLSNGNAAQVVNTMFSAISKQEDKGSKLQPL